MIKVTKRDFIFCLLGFCIAGVFTNFYGCFIFDDASKIQNRESGISAKKMNANEKPSIINGSFYSPHLNIKDLLTDVYLNSLIASSKKKNVLDVLYGKPSSERREGEVVFANYNLAIYYEPLRRERGRIGFVATFEKDIITHWSPITQE